MDRVFIFLFAIALPGGSFAGKIVDNAPDQEPRQEQTQTPMLEQNDPPEGGILGRLLEYARIATWYSNLFGALDPLDHLALAGTNQAAHLIVPNDVVLHIETYEDLERLFALDGTVALSHIVELEFKLSDNDANRTLRFVLDFLARNATRLKELRSLEFDILDDWREQDFHILWRALFVPNLRSVLLQTTFLFHICLEEPHQYEPVVGLIGLLENDVEMQAHVTLEIDSDNETLHFTLLEILKAADWKLKGLSNLVFRGNSFSHQPMKLLEELLRAGAFVGLRGIDFVDTNLNDFGLRLIGQALHHNRFPRLREFHFEDTMNSVLLTQEDALAYFLPIFRTHQTLEEFVFISNTLVPREVTERFFNSVFASSLCTFSLKTMILVGFGDELLEIMLRLASRFQTLEVLDLRGNVFFNKDLIARLRIALPRCEILVDERGEEVTVFALDDDEIDGTPRHFGL